MTLTVERGPYAGVARAEIRRRVDAMIHALQLDNVEVSLLLSDDERIHQLNKVYRHKDRPTDVLAFAMREGDFAELAGSALGDVIVSVPTARKQADERGVTVLDEVTMLAAHGLLHLLGWDHETAAKDRQMRAETERLCQAAMGAGVPQDRKGTTGRLSNTPPRHTKAGGNALITRNRTAVVDRSPAEKVHVPRPVKARRSPKA